MLLSSAEPSMRRLERGCALRGPRHVGIEAAIDQAADYVQHNRTGVLLEIAGVVVGEESGVSRGIFGLIKAPKLELDVQFSRAPLFSLIKKKAANGRLFCIRLWMIAFVRLLLPRRQAKLPPDHVSNDWVNVIVLRAKAHYAVLERTNVPIARFD